MACHAGYGIIHNYGYNFAFVVDYFCRARHSAMEEGGVPHYAEYLFILNAALPEGLRHAHCNRKAAAHAYATVYGGKRCRRSKRITAYIPGHYRVLVTGYRIEESAMGASRAEYRRTRNWFYIKLNTCSFLSKQPFLKYLRVKLVHIADQFLAHALYTCRPDLLLHKAVKLLYNVKLIYLLRKASY